MADHEYKENTGKEIFSKTLAQPQKKRLFKSENVKINSSTRVISANNNKSGHKETKVVPIRNNDEIVGVLVECSCGEVVKVLFNYE